MKDVCLNSLPKQIVKKTGERGQSSSQIISREPQESWALAKTRETWSLHMGGLMNRTKYHRVQKHLSSTYFYKSHPKWHLLHPLSLITTEWAWTENFPRLSGGFLLFPVTSLNDACCVSGEIPHLNSSFVLRSPDSKFLKIDWLVPCDPVYRTRQYRRRVKDPFLPFSFLQMGWEIQWEIATSPAT